MVQGLKIPNITARYFHFLCSLESTKYFLFLLPAATKLGQGNVFTGVCDSVHREGRVSASVHAGMPDPPPPGTGTSPWSRHHPPDQAPFRTRHPPPGADTPPDQAPPPEADPRIRSMSRRYASYWNAFLCFK